MWHPNLSIKMYELLPSPQQSHVTALTVAQTFYEKYNVTLVTASNHHHHILNDSDRCPKVHIMRFALGLAADLTDDWMKPPYMLDPNSRWPTFTSWQVLVLSECLRNRSDACRKYLHASKIYFACYMICLEPMENETVVYCCRHCENVHGGHRTCLETHFHQCPACTFPMSAGIIQKLTALNDEK